MKLSTIALTATLITASSSIFAAETQFEKRDNNIETQACVTAAKEGMGEARKLLKENNINYRTFKANVMCNGLSFSQFANKYALQRFNGIKQEETLQVVALSAMDRTVESQACLDAVTIGERAAREKHDLKFANLECNGVSITSFLKSFRDKKVITKDS